MTMQAHERLWKERIEKVQTVLQLNNAQVANMMDVSIETLKAIKKGHATPPYRARVLANSKMGTDWPLNDLETLKGNGNGNGNGSEDALSMFDTLAPKRPLKKCLECGDMRDAEEDFIQAVGRTAMKICRECYRKKLGPKISAARVKQEAAKYKQTDSSADGFYRQKHRYSPGYLKAVRYAAGISQEALGQLIDVHRVQICRYETGQHVPPRETQKKITNLGKYLQQYGQMPPKDADTVAPSKSVSTNGHKKPKEKEEQTTSISPHKWWLWPSVAAGGALAGSILTWLLQ